VSYLLHTYFTTYCFKLTLATIDFFKHILKMIASVFVALLSAASRKFFAHFRVCV